MSDYVKHNASTNNLRNGGESWVILSSIERSIKEKIEQVGTPLKEWDIKIFRGILTGCNEAFIITTDVRNAILANCLSTDERKRTENLIRPILRGRDIKRYGYKWADLWLIATFPARHYDINLYPAIRDYLLSNFGMERLEQSGKSYLVNGVTVKARKKTNNKWFETQDSISYWEDFQKPFICYNDIAQRLSFASIENAILLNNTAYFFVVEEGNIREYLLRILNSKIMDWYYRTLSVQLGEKAVRMFSIYMNQLPIPLFSEENKEKDVQSLYGLSDDEIKFIERQ